MTDLKIECANCAACCCSAIPVVTDKDVERIVKATGKKPLSFVKMYSQREISISNDDQGLVKISRGMRIMGLKQKQGRCIFLSKDNKCTIYPARPMTCRTYPMDIKIGRKDRIKEIGFQGKISYKGKTCAAVARIADNGKSLIKDTRKENRHDRAYWAKCDRWNQAPKQGRKFEKFMEFLGL